MQLEIYASPGVTESYERKLFRLSYKWIIESELWMTSIIIFELAAIYFLSTMGDKKQKCVDQLKKLGYNSEEINKIENNY